jgi:hypothetical protein
MKAYGPASDVPKDIQRLASSDPDILDRAQWELFGSIYHQGTVYPATAVAIPFLIDVASDQRLPDRAKVCELLEAIAESSAIDPEKIRQAWNSRRELHGETYSKPTEDKAADQLADMAAVRQAFLNQKGKIQSLQSDPEPEVLRQAGFILQHLEATARAT